jgi:dihydropteroate synthase
MGIVNVTPDSFSDGGLFLDPERAIEHGERLVREGAQLLDVGGESTRPGSDPVPVEEELRRVLPVIEGLVRRVDVPVSVDTRKAAVARAALERGAHLVNDVSACADPEMVEVLKEFDAPVVIMHMKGDPKSMQVAPHYDDVVGEILDFLRARARTLVDRGVPRERIVVDPGIGFGKRFKDNLVILRNLPRFKDLGYRLLVGASRKRFIGELVEEPPKGRVAGSLAVALWCAEAGADLVRVHDVKATVDALTLWDAVHHPEDYRADW